jgi:hypothetical protein
MAGARHLLAQAFRPVGPKIIQTGIPWVNGGQTQINQQVDLSLPIKGIRMVFTGRVVIGGADMASVNPEGFLNLIKEVVIQGVNSRQQGNVTLYDIDAATQFVTPFLYGNKKNFYAISVGGGALTRVGEPNTPFPTGTVASGAWIAVTQATYDFRIVMDFPFHPYESDAFCKAPLTIPGFLVRNEEWKDSLSIRLVYPSVANGAVAGPLGTGAGGTTLTLTAFGSGAGSPTIDLYSLPMEMGLVLKDQFIPGLISRVAQPINTILQSAGTNNTVLANLQKQPTPRVVFKVGVSTSTPAFSALSDANVTTLGVLLGANRNVRNVVDIFSHKGDTSDYYDAAYIQGYNSMDFIQSGNPNSSYPGQDIGDGAQFQLIGAPAGVANAFGLVIQEQILQLPAGPMYEQ